MKKLGFNIQINQRLVGYDEAVKSMKPKVLTLIGDYNDLNYALEMQRDTGALIVFRYIPLEIGPNDPRYGQGDATAQGIKWVTDLVKALGTKLQACKGFYWQCAWDEKKLSLTWNKDFCIAAMKEARKYGLKLCIINLFWGNPGEPQWNGFEGWDELWAAIVMAAAEGHLIGGHAYIDTNAPLTFSGQRHAQTRIVHLIDLMHTRGVNGRIVLTEIGLAQDFDKQGPYGFRTLEDYGDAIIKVDQWFGPYLEVIGLSLYMLGTDSRYPADREVFTKIYNYMKAPVQVPLPTPSPVPQPVPTPTPIPTSKYKITTSGLRLRSGPGLSYSTILVLSPTSVFNVETPFPPLGVAENWVEVSTDSVKGWCWSEYIKRT